MNLGKREIKIEYRKGDLSRWILIGLLFLCIGVVSTTIISDTGITSGGNLNMGNNDITYVRRLNATNITVSGFVGIGTANPTYKLHTVGDAKVTGHIDSDSYMYNAYGYFANYELADVVTGVQLFGIGGDAAITGSLNVTGGYYFGTGGTRPVKAERVMWWNSSTNYHCPQWYNSTHWICLQGGTTKVDAT